MHSLIVRADGSAFDRIRDAVLNRGDSDERDDPTSARGFVVGCGVDGRIERLDESPERRVDPTVSASVDRTR